MLVSAIMITILLLVLSMAAASPIGPEEANEAYLRASFFLKSGDIERALSEIETAIEADPESSHIRTVKGSALMMSGRILEGQSALEKAIELDPSNSKPHKLLGLLLFRQLANGDLAESEAPRAISLLERAAALDPHDLESRYYLAFLYEEKNEIEKMYQVLKSAVEIDNTRPELLKKAAETARQLDKKKDAAEYYERASLYLEKIATRLKENLNIQFELAKTSLWDTGKFDVAVTAYDRIISATKGDLSMLSYRIEAFIGKATALYFMEDYQPAAELFAQQEQYVMSGYPRSIAPMLLAYAETGKADQAVQLLDRLLVAQRENPPFLNFLLRVKGAVLAAGEQYQAAAEVFDRSVSEFPEEGVTWQQYSQVWIDAEEFDKAEEVVQRARKTLGEESIDYLFSKAVLLEKMGEIDRSISLFEQIIEAEPDNDLALNYLGYMFAEEKQNLERAEIYLKKALQYSPNQGSYLDSLGWVYFQMGNLDLAEKYLKKAVRTKYKSPEIREHLGHLFLKLGKKSDALEEFEAALECDLARVKDTTEVELLIESLRKEPGMDK